MRKFHIHLIDFRRVMNQFKNSLFINIFCITVSIVLIGLNLYGLVPSKLQIFAFTTTWIV